MFLSPTNIFDHTLPELKSYKVNFSLKRLTPGVDNIHHDVHISPKLRKSVITVIEYLVAIHSNATELESIRKNTSGWTNARDDFQEICVDVLLNAINQAKLQKEYQVDFLAQAALTKLIMEEIRNRFESLVEHYKNIIRKNEVSRSTGIRTVILLKEELSDLLNNRRRIISQVAGELFQLLVEIQKQDVQNIRESNFGSTISLPGAFFSNPVINSENSSSDHFLIEAYVLFGNRLNDPIKYTPIIDLLQNFYFQISHKNERAEITESTSPEEMKQLSGLINEIGNMDSLFNYFEYEKKIKEYKHNKKSKDEILGLKNEAKIRRNRLNYFFKKMKTIKMIDGIIASFEIQQIYRDYCPPLNPLEVLKYLVSPKERNEIALKLKRLKGSDGKAANLKPLIQAAKKQKKTKDEVRRQYLFQYLKGIVSYHRDLHNYKILKEAMDWINLTDDENTLRLSRINHTLYDFLHSSEQTDVEKPVVNHVILKTDVRGSTDITHQIKERGLNPASYFSFNFFNPITEMLAEYGAEKVFIEGDAIILSIFEKEDTPKDWYAVARACGLAINMLMITQRYNAKSKKHRLPILEQGIGICYRNTPPTYLFDGDNQIMISPAINLADRLSGCTKSLRKKFAEKKLPFNLYVYQRASDENMNGSSDDQLSRYNVNGIELNQEGFDKLKEEINLQKIRCHAPNIQDEKFIVYTGTFPTISGKYQRLVIREAEISLVSDDTLDVIRMTNRKYYEVCTNRKLYEFIKNAN